MIKENGLSRRIQVTFKANINCKNRRTKWIKQGIKINGLGTATFELVTESVKTIHDVFDDFFAAGRLEGLENNGESTLSASNRYFTHRKDVGQAKSVPFGEGVDPKGVLQMLADADYIHTEENEVVYYKRSEGTKV